MKFTLGEIADLVSGELVGSPDIVITGIAGIKESKEGDITFLANSKYASLVKTTKASAIITSKEITGVLKPLIRTENPSLAFARVVDLAAADNAKHPQGVHPTAIIAPSAKLSSSVGVGPYVIVDEEVEVGERTVIYGGGYIGRQTKIGKDCLFYPHVAIREKTVIGSRVIIHCGAVIASDGFGFAAVDGIQEKIPQIGIVVIEDDVEIGANVTIDRARFDKTVIGRGTKIDNLVQIGHNVVIGPNCIIVAQAGISGSTTLGNGVVLAGQAGLAGHIRVGDKAVVAAQAGVTKSIPAHTKVSGYPARPHETAKRVNACIQRLPQLYKKIKELEDKISALESQRRQDA